MIADHIYFYVSRERLRFTFSIFACERAYVVCPNFGLELQKDVGVTRLNVILDGAGRSVCGVHSAAGAHGAKVPGLAAIPIIGHMVYI